MVSFLFQIKSVSEKFVTTYYTRSCCFSLRVGQPSGFIFIKLNHSSSFIWFVCTFLFLNALSVAIQADVALRGYWTLLAVLCLTHIATATLMLATTLTEPGAIPQQVSGYELDKDNFAIPLNQRPQPPYLFLTGSLAVNLKYCLECRIHRPPRTIHCAACNHCVQRFDHHCPWIGVCIGKRNYRIFIFFLASAILHTLMALVVSIAIIITSYNSDFTALLAKTAVLFVVALFSLWFCIALIVLFAYHLKLLKIGATTNEDLKRLYSWAANSQVFPSNNTINRPKTQSLLQCTYFYRNKVQTHQDSPLTPKKQYGNNNLDSERVSATKPLIDNLLL